MTHVETLQKAKALIQDPNAWCQNLLSLENRHCALGAILVAEGVSILSRRPLAIPRDYLYTACGGSVVRFNDTHTHIEVMALFDKAIQLALEAEASERQKATVAEIKTQALQGAKEAVYDQGSDPGRTAELVSG